MRKLFGFDLYKLLVLMGISIVSLLVASFVGNLGWWSISLVMYFIYACLGVVIGFHRLLSHRSFVTKEWIEKALMIIGTLAGNGSSITWLMVHVDHHMYSDTDKDPHTPKQGFLNSIMLKYTKNRVKSKYVLRVAHDPFHRFLHNWYFAIHFVWIFILYLTVGWKLILFAHLVPIGFVSIMSHLNNWINHTCGYKNYDSTDNSKNNMWLAIPTFGESWHNNHHVYPSKAKLGHKWWEIDIAWLVIRIIRI